MLFFVVLFQMFWRMTLLKKIVKKRNCYAQALERNGNIPERVQWKMIMVSELKIFLVCTLYMGMKHQPNVKMYWSKLPSIFHISIISRIFFQPHFELLTKCLHLRNSTTYVSDSSLLGNDKMNQLTKKMGRVKDNFKVVWS